MFVFHRFLYLAVGLFIAGSGAVVGQHPVAMEQRLPFEVTLSERGLEVSAYDGGDALLQPGDVITWVATPDSDETGVEVTSVEELTIQVLENLDKEGRIAVWVTRGNEEPVWIVVPVSSKAVSSRSMEQTVTVKTVDGGVEVVSYPGSDGLLQPGDLISWVSTPGSDDAGAEVTDPHTFQTELRARQDGEGNVALFVKRRDHEPDWMIVPLTSTRRDPREMSNHEDFAEHKAEGMESQLDVPFTVITKAEGLEVTEYRGTDGLLRPGDYLTRVASIPTAGQSVGLSGLTPEQFEQQCRDCASKSATPGQIAVFREDNVNGHWVSMRLYPFYMPKVNLSTRLSFTVKAAKGGVKVLETGDNPQYPWPPLQSVLAVGDVITHVYLYYFDIQTKRLDDLSDTLPVATREAFEKAVVSAKGEHLPGSEGFSVRAERPASPDSPLGLNIYIESPLGVPTLNDARKLHVLLVYDTDPSLKQSNLTFSTNWNAYRLREFIERSIPEELRSEIETMTTDSWSRESLLQKLNSMAAELGTKDTFAVFFCGVHGSNEEGVGHVFHLPRPNDSPEQESETVTRAEIHAAISQSPARLKMLVTESCTHGLAALDHGYTPKPFVMSDHRNAYWNANAARYLFFRHKGFLDVNSSSPGQYSRVAVSYDIQEAFGRAFYKPEFKTKTLFQQYKWVGEEYEAWPEVFEDGGMFTSSLLKIISKDDGKLSELGLLDAKGRLTWEKVLPEVQKETSNLSLRFYDIDQTPFTIEVPEIVGDALPQKRTNKPQLNALDTDVSQSINRSILGMDLYQGTNCVVVGMPYLGMDEFLDGSPAWYPLRQGDEITHVQLSDSYFWRGFDPYSPLFNRLAQSYSIKTLDDLHQLLLHHNGDGTLPNLCQGMWKFTVRRDGKNKEIDVRVTSPSITEISEP